MLNKISFNSKELEKATGISIRRWRDLRDLGLIKTTIIGRREIWLRSDVERVLEGIKGRNLQNKRNLMEEER